MNKPLIRICQKRVYILHISSISVSIHRSTNLWLTWTLLCFRLCDNMNIRRNTYTEWEWEWEWEGIVLIKRILDNKYHAYIHTWRWMVKDLYQSFTCTIMITMVSSMDRTQWDFDKKYTRFPNSGAILLYDVS